MVEFTCMYIYIYIWYYFSCTLWWGQNITKSKKTTLAEFLEKILESYSCFCVAESHWRDEVSKSSHLPWATAPTEHCVLCNSGLGCIKNICGSEALLLAAAATDVIVPVVNVGAVVVFDVTFWTVTVAVVVTVVVTDALVVDGGVG